MSHYDRSQWVDYVRGLVDPDTEAAMCSHLETGCSSCSETTRRVEALAAFARTDQRFEPPPHLIQFAKAVFSLHTPARVPTLPPFDVRAVRKAPRRSPVRPSSSRRATRADRGSGSRD